MVQKKTNLSGGIDENNKGFSLFTVLIAVSFVGILGLLVLYMALSNFNMKVTDLKGKDSFYTAERAIEEIRAGLQEDVGDAMSKAYTQVLETYNKNTKLEDTSLDKQRQSDFEDLFIKELVKNLKLLPVMAVLQEMKIVIVCNI